MKGSHMANTYGDNGNRWWVGLNVGSDQSTIIGTSSILSPNGYESLPSGNANDDAQFAAAAKKDAGSVAKPVTISVENVKWFNINGPYTTQASANAAIAAIQKAHPAPGEAAQLQKTGIPGVAQVGGAITGLQNTLGFLDELSSANLWIRVAKVAIGGVILIVGLVKLTGADKAIGGIAATAVKAAPLL